MRRSGLALSAAVLAFAGWRAPPAAWVAAQAPVEQWRAFEITLTSNRQYANPFLDVEVIGAFTGPSGVVLKRPAFWDGGDVWKIRVALTEAGRWTYQVTASDPDNAGLNPAPGAVDCVPYAGRLPIYQHGFLRVSPDGRYLAYADGTPFFWLGDTHWFFDRKERWDTSNDPRWPSQFRGIVDQRVAQGFSVYQSVIFGPDPIYWAPGQVGRLVNPDYLREQLDPKLHYLADQGLVVAFGLGFHSNIDGRQTALVNLARYLVARYGANPMVWITGGEVAGYDPALRQARLDGWRQVAQEIDRWDTYNQPQTAHYTSDNPTYYQGEAWFDFTMLQRGHSGSVDVAQYLTYYQTYTTTPLLEGEANYEQFFPTLTADVVRASAYRAIQAGSFGYTYGAQGIWNAAWDDADTANDFNGSHWNWNQALDFPGATQMSYLARFYRNLPWETLIPRPAGWADWLLEPDGADQPEVKAADDGSQVVVYFPADYNPEQTAGALVNLPNQTYSLRWYNPRTGRSLFLGAATLGLHRWVIETKPDPGDWLLWLRATTLPPAPASLAAARASGNLALGQRYRSPSNATADQAAARAFDGDSQTQWQPDAGQPYSSYWLEVDFDQDILINAAAITELDYRTRGYRVDVWSGTGWETAATGALLGHLEPHFIRFPTVSGSRVRLVFTAGVQTPIIGEFELFYLPGRTCLADQDTPGERPGGRLC